MEAGQGKTHIHITSISNKTTEWLEMAINTIQQLKGISIKSGIIGAEHRDVLAKIKTMAEQKGVAVDFDEADLATTIEQRMAPLRIGRKWNAGTLRVKRNEAAWYQKFNKNRGV